MSFYGNRSAGDRVEWDVTFIDGVATAVTSLSGICRKLSNGAFAPAGLVMTTSGGLCKITVFTGSSSTFFVAGEDYSVIVATGTLGGVSIQDFTLGQFSILNRSSNVVNWNGSAPSNLISGRVDANTQAMAAGVIAAATFSAGAVDAAAIAANAVDAASLASDIWTKSLGTEAYAADTAVPTMAEAMFMMLSMFGQFAITTTTISTKKLDGTTESMQFQLDSATTPTSRTRIL